MSQDLLKLENEFRKELPKYKEKPKIIRLAPSSKLKDNIANFLDVAKKEGSHQKSTVDNECDIVKDKAQVYMDILMVEEADSDQ